MGPEFAPTPPSEAARFALQALKVTVNQLRLNAGFAVAARSWIEDPNHDIPNNQVRAAQEAVRDELPSPNPGPEEAVFNARATLFALATGRPLENARDELLAVFWQLDDLNRELNRLWHERDPKEFEASLARLEKLSCDYGYAPEELFGEIKARHLKYCKRCR